MVGIKATFFPPSLSVYKFAQRKCSWRRGWASREVSSLRQLLGNASKASGPSRWVSQGIWRFLFHCWETCIRTFLFFFCYIMLRGQTSVDVLLPPHDREVPPSVLRGFTGVSDYWVTLAAQRHWALDLSPSALCSWRKKPIGNEFSLAALGFQFLYFVPSLSHLSGSTPPV